MTRAQGKPRCPVGGRVAVRGSGGEGVDSAQWGSLWSCHPHLEPGPWLGPGLWNSPAGSLDLRVLPCKAQLFLSAAKSRSHLPLNFSKVSFSITKLSLIYSHEYLSPIHSAFFLWPGMGRALGSERYQAGPKDYSSARGGESRRAESQERTFAKSASFPSPTASPNPPNTQLTP